MKYFMLCFAALLISSTTHSQNTHWIRTQLPGQYPFSHHQAFGETCMLFACDTSQAVHAFDINQGEWQTLLVPTQLDWVNVAADGNVAMIFNDSIVAGYSAITSTFSAITYTGEQSVLNMIPYGCIDNFAYLLTDQYLYVFDAGDGQWHSFSYTHPGETPWGGGIRGKGDYIYLNLWPGSNSSLNTTVAYSLHTKTFDELIQPNIESFTLLDHGFTIITSILADPYVCAGYSAFTGEFITKTHSDIIYKTDPGVWTEIVSPLICGLFTTREEISHPNYIDYIWVFNTVVGDFAAYSYETSWNHYQTAKIKCGGQTAFAVINNVDAGGLIEYVVYSALTHSFSHFNTPLASWGNMSFSAGGLMIDGYDQQNYFLYDVETQASFTHPVQWTEGIQPGVKGRGLGNYWAVFAYTEQYEDTTHVFSYTRNDGTLTPFTIPLRASTSNYRGKDLFGLLMTDQGPLASAWIYSPQNNVWTEKDLTSISYFGSEGNYIYINYPDQNQTWFYDALANQEYGLTSAQHQAHVLARDSVFAIYTPEGKYIGYSLIEQDSSEYHVNRYPGQQWNNFIVLNLSSDKLYSSEYLLYDGYKNQFAPLQLTDEEGPGVASWVAGKTALVATQNGYLYAYYPELIDAVDEPQDESISLSGKEFVIYPNPAMDKFSVQHLTPKAGGAIIEIYDLSGRKLLEKTMRTGVKNIEIDVSSWKSGIYLCKISTAKNSLTKKLIVQK